jgi:hypothetical protein
MCRLTFDERGMGPFWNPGPGIESERSSGGGIRGGMGMELVVRPRDGWVLLGTGVRSRSISFGRLIFGGGAGWRSKDDLLIRGGGDCGFFWRYMSTVRSTSRLTCSNCRGCSMQKHVSKWVRLPSFRSFCTCVNRNPASRIASLQTQLAIISVQLLRSRNATDGS